MYMPGQCTGLNGGQVRNSLSGCSSMGTPGDFLRGLMTTQHMKTLQPYSISPCSPVHLLCQIQHLLSGIYMCPCCGPHQGEVGGVLRPNLCFQRWGKRFSLTIQELGLRGAAALPPPGSFPPCPGPPSGLVPKGRAGLLPSTNLCPSLWVDCEVLQTQHCSQSLG